MAAGGVVDIESDTDFARRTGGGLAVVDFYATWCGPCKAVAPQIDVLARKYPDVTFVKVDVDRHQSLASRFGVSAMPTFVVLSRGSQVGSVKGADAGGVERLVREHRNAAGPKQPAFPGSGHRLGPVQQPVPAVAAARVRDSPLLLLLALLVVFIAYLYFNRRNPSHITIPK